ncbi:MAG: ABC transporter substrate-binding protein [Eubacteriales bacterium]
MAEATDPDYVTELPEDTDLSGYDFYILARLNENDYAKTNSWTSHDMDCEAENGDPIDDAVYKRNSSIEEKYNCNIHMNYSGDVAGDIKKLVSSGDNTYSIALPPSQAAAVMASEGYLSDLNNMPYINLSKKYWDQGLVSGVKINNKVYFATGDIMMMDDDATWVFYFNKSLVSEYSLKSPYDYVRNDEWTMDTLYKTISSVSADLDGDGKYTMEDRYGLVTHNGGFGMFQYFGAQPIITSESGELQITFDNERMYKLIEITTAISKDMTASYTFTDWSDGVNMFADSKALFYVEVLDKFRHLRGADVDFGVIPAPKLDEAQENYTTAFDAITSVVVVPSSNTSDEQIGFILEAMAGGSVNTLTSAYYDTNLTTKYMRDEDSIEMLEIILRNRIYDLGRFYTIGGTQGIFSSVISQGNNDFASQYAKIADKAQTELAKLIEKFA